MEFHTIGASYRQFYIADMELQPQAPEEWTDENIQNRFNARSNIVALVPEGDLTARIAIIPPSKDNQFPMNPDFQIKTEVEIPSGKIGVLEWPWELLEEFEVTPGKYSIIFNGYDTASKDEENDYYVVKIQAT